MRRILTIVALLIVAPSITEAWCGSTCTYSYVHFTPYAFGYHSNGLVPGGIVYSPYAFSASTSGLVFDGVRYNPYAFGYGRTGLILDYSASGLSYVTSTAVCAPLPPCAPHGTAPAARSYGQSAPSPSTRGYAAAKAPARDMMYTIRDHLREHGYKDVAISRIMRVDGELVGVDFTLPGQKLLIKYTNPEQLDALRRQGDSMQKALQRYNDNWETAAARHEQAGGTIVHIADSDVEQVVAALDSCLPSTPGDSASSSQPVYAKN